MTITKYGHACLFIENNGEKLVIDPGGFTELPQDLKNITAIVVTHMHGDHLNQPNLHKILGASPTATIYGTEEVVAELGSDFEGHKVAIKDVVVVEHIGVSTTLTPVDHAVIYQQSPCKNLTVKVGDVLYYPGDTLTPMQEKVSVLALPTSAPWLKVAEAMDFCKGIAADKCFPTHNGLLNDAGHATTNNWLQQAAQDSGKEFVFLQNGNTIKITS